MLRACWLTQAPVGSAATPRPGAPGGVELDEEQHVEMPEEHGVDGQEVRGQDAGRAAAFKELAGANFQESPTQPALGGGCWRAPNLRSWLLERVHPAVAGKRSAAW